MKDVKMTVTTKTIDDCDWLLENFNSVINQLLSNAVDYNGLIYLHAHKCEQYKDRWESAGVPYRHGIVLYLMGKMHPWTNEVRDTKTGWVHPVQWVIDNYKRFQDVLPEV